MHYKTITLEFLQLHPQMYDRLLKSRTLLTTLHFYASELRESHMAWKERLSETMAGSSESQIAGEALEIALKEMEDTLAAESLPDESQELSLDAAMAFIVRHRTQPA